MKSLKRRLLSLFLAMVMVLSLAPGALAEDPPLPNNPKWEGGSSQNPCSHTSYTYNLDTAPTCTATGIESWTCSSCGAKVTNNNVATLGHDFTNSTTYVQKSDKHYKVCARSGCDTEDTNGTACAAATSPTYIDATNGHKKKCATCGNAFGAVENHTPGNWVTSDKDKHWKVCSACNTKVDENTHSWTNNTCGTCGATKASETVTVKSVSISPTKVSMERSKTTTLTVKVMGTDDKPKAGVQVSIGRTGESASASATSVTTNADGEATFTVTSDATKTGETTFTATAGGQSATCKVTVSDGITIDFNTKQSVNGGSKTDSTLSVAYDDIIALSVEDVKVKSGTIDVTNSYEISFKWMVDSSTTSVTRSSYSFYADDNCTVKCTVTATPKSEVTGTAKTKTTSWTVKISSDITVNATVSGNYVLSDADDKTNDSIWEKIEDELQSGFSLDYITFDSWEHRYGDLEGVSSRTTKFEEDDLSDVEFVPEEKGTAQFSFVAHVLDRSDNARSLKGILYIEVKDTTSSSSGDITYMAELGEDVYFEVSDFEDYFDDKFSSGSLDYVIFESASNGKVKDGRSTVDYENDKYYVDPGKNQDDLADVYFAPNSSKKAMTGTVKFTVYGTKSSQKRAGTITIYYLNDNASDITYNTVNGKVTLDPKDFEAAYKEATSSKTAPSNLVIEFQNVPTNGTLTYTGGSRDKDLTKSTVKGTRYTTKSSGSNRLAQLTYSGTKGKDTIDYIAYSGGTAQFSGRVVFNGTAAVPQDVVVYYASTAGQPARFSQNDFTTANSAMSKAAKIRFVTPANGTLYLNGSTSAAGIDIAPALLYSVTYQPKAGFNGTDKVVFAAYDASNNLVANGSVNITVAGNPTTSTTPGGTTNPGGVTDVSQFTDVSGNAWYRANLATLVSKGVISGRGDGKFDPKGTVTYGEALKMVLESCGYTAAVGTGSQWAINYKNLAVSKGWISSSVDLNAAISRNATAELAAKVLGVAPVTSGSPFGDEANAYAVALYYTTPQIFVGTTNPNGGKPLFENNKPLLREQVCAVICRVSDYHTQHTTNVMPDGV